MIQKILTLIALTTFAAACTTNASIEAKDPRDAKIAKLERQVQTLLAQRDTPAAAKQETPAAPEQKGANGIITPTWHDAKKREAPPQAPARPLGPNCGQTGPSVAYVDYKPAGLTDEGCAGNCTIFINDTDRYVTIESPGGEKKLICGGYIPLQATTIDTEISTRVPTQISFIPPGRTVRWINPSGLNGFVAKYYSRQYDGSLVKVSQRISDSYTYPYVAFGIAGKVGLTCNASGIF